MSELHNPNTRTDYRKYAYTARVTSVNKRVQPFYVTALATDGTEFLLMLRGYYLPDAYRIDDMHQLGISEIVLSPNKPFKFGVL